MKLSAGDPRSGSFRRGFTLVEMLVAITIFAILATIAIGSFSEIGSDRVPAAARQLRSMIAGAQSRAAKDRASRGLRLLLDPTLSVDFDNLYVTSLVYVGTNTDVEGVLVDQTLPATATSPARQVKLVPSGVGWRIRQPTTGPNAETILWSSLTDDGTVDNRYLSPIRPGMRLFLQWTTNTEIEAQERMFVVHHIGEDLNNNEALDMGEDTNGDMNLDRDYLVIAGSAPPPSLTGNIRYRLELAPEILPNSEPVSLPRGTVIDLNASILPSVALTNGFIDILFSPRGEIQGSLAGEGSVHFYVGQLDDSQNERVLNATEMPRIINGDANNPVTGPQRVVSVIPATGQVLAAEYVADIPYSMMTPAGPFTIAVQGREAK